MDSLRSGDRVVVTKESLRSYRQLGEVGFVYFCGKVEVQLDNGKVITVRPDSVKKVETEDTNMETQSETKVYFCSHCTGVMTSIEGKIEECNTSLGSEDLARIIQATSPQVAAEKFVEKYLDEDYINDEDTILVIGEGDIKTFKMKTKPILTQI